MLRVQFVESYWPNHHLKLYERLVRGEFGKVLNGMVFAPQSRIKYNVVAKLLLRAHLDKLYNEIGIYQTHLVRLGNKAVPKV